MTAPSDDSRRLEAELADILARVSALEEGLRATQLDRSSIDDGVLELRGPDGSTLATWGVQPDGTAATKSFNKVPPPAPAAATLTPLMAGIDVAWGGQLVGNMPADFLCVRVHLSATADFAVATENYVGSLFEDGSLPIAPLPYVPHYVKLVAVNHAGAVSQASAQATATPAKVVADDVLAGVVSELKLAEQAVTEAKIAAAAVTGTKVADNAISTPKLITGAVQADKLAVDSVQAGKIAASAVTAREVKAQSLTGDTIAANAIQAGHVKAGAITATKLEANLALATRLIAGTPTGTRVELSSSGLLVVRADGEITFQVDSATGDVVSMGQYYTKRFGERIAMNVAGLSEPAIRAYPRRGNRYADLRSYTRTIGSTDVANWEVRLPLIGQEAGLFDFMVYDSSYNAITSTRLRYRPFFNRSNIAHCGWAADGQDAAIVFFQGRAFITNSANSDRRGLNCGDLYVEDGAQVVKNLTVRGATFSNGVNTSSLQVGAAGAPADRQITTVNLTADNNIWAKNQVLQGPNHVAVTSEARMKNEHRRIDNGLDVVRALRPIVFDWKDKRRGEGVYAGVYVDELAEVAPEAVHDRGRPEDIPGDAFSWEDKVYLTDGRTYDVDGLCAYLVDAVQTLDRQNRDLRDQLDRLRGQDTESAA